MNKESIIKGLTLFKTVIVILVIFTILWLFLPVLTSHPRIARRFVCQHNLEHLGIAMRKYANETSGNYPSPDKWCDLIKPYFRREADNIMRCPAVKEGKCHYAMNPNCEPNSPSDAVLLFETKGGWNLSGGPELLVTEKHGGSGCNILFNDGSVNYVQKDEIANLKWNAVKRNE